MRRSGVVADEVRRICLLLSTDDPRLVKNGIQSACELLEAQRPHLSRHQVDLIRAGLSDHLGSKDRWVLSWVYKLIGLLGDHQYTPYLRGQLLDRDFVAENRTWAVAALALVAIDHRKHLLDIGEELSTPYRLSASFFRPQHDTGRAINDAGNNDDRLAHQWLGLLYGETRADVPLSLITQLTASPYPEVAEYAIWGLRKRHQDSMSKVLISPDQLNAKPPNVRRWYYRMLLQDPSNIVRYSYQLRTWIGSESDSKAREGLAAGFVDVGVNAEWLDVLRSWAQMESDPYVLQALLRKRVVASAIGSPPTQLAGQQDSRKRQRPVSLDLPYRSQSDPQRTRLRYNVSLFRSEVFIVTDRRDQRVNVHNSGHIGSVQGADSQISEAEDLVEVLWKLISLLRSEAQTSPTDDGLGQAIDDLETAVQDNRGGPRWHARIGARLQSIAGALAGAVAVSQSTQNLLSSAQDLVHKL